MDPALWRRRATTTDVCVPRVCAQQERPLQRDGRPPIAAKGGLRSPQPEEPLCSNKDPPIAAEGGLRSLQPKEPLCSNEDHHSKKIIYGLAQKFVQFFYTTLWRNLDELLGQLNNSFTEISFHSHSPAVIIIQHFFNEQPNVSAGCDAAMFISVT